ncbi:MAG: hypothetical protein P8J61_08430 [Gammaproteobacteria bacterium]|nr:hypothetical protein [Gammaproteobacteria bacterium]
MNSGQLTNIQKLCIFIGLLFLTLSVLIFLGVLIGLLELSQFEFIGHSGLRSVAALAVSGCLMAAIGLHNK